ncbi:MAG: GNAT family N-acetyltransferase [Gemmatimonadaceae bacterium]|nr:GNAT family N-acetyltransferase [Acetobacteraceae bacterium]
MQLRLAVPGDLAVVQSITNAAYAVWEPIMGAPAVPVTEDYVPRIVRQEVWLVERDGTALAVMVAEPTDDHLLIFSLAVPPAHQAQGIGRFMLAAAERQATAAGLRGIRLFTGDRMVRNIAMYGRWGFIETGRRPNPYRPGWTLVDMVKPLVPV